MAKRTESYWTRKLQQHLKEKYPSWLLYKFADHFTAGIPDFAVITTFNTVWLELKLLREKEGIVDCVFKGTNALQFHDIRKIEQLGQPCWYVIFLPGDELSYYMLRPSFIKETIEYPFLRKTIQRHVSFSYLENICLGG